MTIVWGLDGLTGQERKVAHLAATGLTNAQIAIELNVSRHTVDFHLRQAYLKTGVHSRVLLTRLLLQEHAS